jgi:hypothetical protein
MCGFLSGRLRESDKWMARGEGPLQSPLGEGHSHAVTFFPLQFLDPYRAWIFFEGEQAIGNAVAQCRRQRVQFLFGGTLDDNLVGHVRLPAWAGTFQGIAQRASGFGAAFFD